MQFLILNIMRQYSKCMLSVGFLILWFSVAWFLVISLTVWSHCIQRCATFSIATNMLIRNCTKERYTGGDRDLPEAMLILGASLWGFIGGHPGLCLCCFLIVRDFISTINCCIISQPLEISVSGRNGLVYAPSLGIKAPNWLWCREIYIWNIYHLYLILLMRCTELRSIIILFFK